MTPVENYISELLHFHDCVIVPGLGGFVANYKPSSIQEKGNLFLPPSKEIGFNRSLSHSDGLLIDFVSRRERVSYPDASLKVSRFARDVHERVSAGYPVDLGEVGTLKRDAIGNLQFTPRNGTSFLPEALGLASFRFEVLDQKRKVWIDAEGHVPRLLRSRSPRYWAAAATLAAGLFIFNPELKTPSINRAEIGAFITLPAANDVNHAMPPVSIIDHHVDKPLITGNAGIDTPGLPVTAADNYHVIAASFNQTVPADKALAEFLQQGFTGSRLIDNGQGRVRVAIASFANRQDALNALADFRKQPAFANAWVLISR